MSVEVTARHMQATAELQAYARGKGELLFDEFPRLEHVHIILDVQKRHCIAEIVVQAKNKIRTEAEDRSENMLASIDHAFDRIERQLRRLRDKVVDHKGAMRHGELGKERGG